MKYGLLKKIIFALYVLSFSITSAASDGVIISQSVNTGTSTENNSSTTSTSTSNPEGAVVSPFSAFLNYLVPLTDKYGVLIQEISIEEGDTFLFLNWKTNIKAKSEVSWGFSIDNEAGSIVESDFDTAHSILIGDLQPQRRYFIKIYSTSTNGQYSEKIYEVETNKLGTDLLPPNVENSKLQVKDPNKITLSWNIPLYSEFKSVRVVKSDVFFPSDPSDGLVIYEGKGREVVDSISSKKNYYTIFLEKNDGRFSSGVTLSYYMTGRPSDVLKEDQPESQFPIIPLTLSDFIFVQSGKIISPSEKGISIEQNHILKISIATDKTPKVLKTILITLTNSKKEKSSFLLRVNDTKSEYSALISPRFLTGIYEGHIQIFDYKNGSMNSVPFTLTIEKKNSVKGLFGEKANGTAIDIKKSIKEIIEMVEKLISLIFQYFSRV